MAAKSLKKRVIKRLPKSLKKAFSRIASDLEALSGIRRGSRASRVLRYGLEKFNIKAILGGNLAFAVLATGLISPASTQSAKEAETATLPAPVISLSTDVQIRYPVEKVKINQGFSRFHYGLDIDGETGDPIYPIMKGTIELEENGRFGYGNQIIVNHGNGLKSRYAHLSKFEAKLGQEVKPEQVIGKIGTSGFSTGSHLHLEIIQNNQAINPQAVLSRK
ncbi:MAG: M23 family metallopeptidase [bacterium]|nr:M23 family metallopeptidase [bacterium]